MKFRMRMIGVVVGVIGLPLVLFGQFFQAIEYENALSLAAENNQLIWLNFNSPADELCVQMDEAVFSNPQIQGVGKSFVRLRVDARSSTGRHLMAQYRVTELPASIFINSAGEEIERITGYLAAPFFLQKIKKIRSGVDTFAALEEKYERDPMNGELAFQLAKKCVLMGQKLRAIELFENVVTLDMENNCGCLPEVYFNLGTLAMALDDPELASYYWDVLVQDFPKSKYVNKLPRKQNIPEKKPVKESPDTEADTVVSDIPEKIPELEPAAVLEKPVALMIDTTATAGKEEIAEADTLAEHSAVPLVENVLAPADTLIEPPPDSTVNVQRDFATVSVTFDLDSTVKDYAPEVAVIWQDSVDLDSAKADFPTVTVIGVDTSMWSDTPVDWELEPESPAAADSFDYYLARAGVFLNTSRSQQGLRHLVRAYQLEPDNVVNLKRLSEMAMLFEIRGNAPVFWAAQAVELTEHKVADLLHVLAEMYAMNSLYHQAIEVEQEALDVAKDSDPKRLYAKRIQAWQQLEKEMQSKEKK